MRKNARFTHDTTNFGHDVRGKRFRTHETKNIEYKSNWRDKHLKYICGFANANGGKIYIGIEDDASHNWFTIGAFKTYRIFNKKIFVKSYI